MIAGLHGRHSCVKSSRSSPNRPRTPPATALFGPVFLRHQAISDSAAGETPYASTPSGYHLATMYIRVKRNKTTYFIQCDPTETTLSIKQKLQSLIDQPASNQQLILLSKDNVVVLLDDLKTLADQKVENDAVVALTLRKDDNEFEDVFIARPEDFMTSS